jgi:perosamine synthetase
MTVLVPMAPLPPDTWTRRPRRRLPFPLDEGRCHLLARGRHALWHGMMTAALRPGDEVLAPAYHHGSEIEAFVRAGLRCRFYEATPTLAPDPDELARLLAPRTRALHLVHYLGFPQDARRWRRWCDERGIFLIEDAAQAWLSATDGEPVGTQGDVAIFCLYKTFGLPDGAAVRLTRGVASRPLRRDLGLAGLGLEHLLWLAGRSALLGGLLQRVRPPRRRHSEGEMALGEPRRCPSAVTMLALSRIADDGAAVVRRGHYEELLQRLPDLVAAPFAHLPPGASPFVFPIATADKRGMLARLGACGIRALDLWSVPHPMLPADEFPAAAELRARVVGLPVHQELTAADIERIGSAARAAAGG